uniref:Uncharacterized protein n=1 Tax=Cacopsylla melanoneura TaxID=428564 RepID=A0A8D9E7C8_9HEMI
MCITFGLRHLIPERDHANRLQPTASSNRISDPPPITRQSRILLAVASLSVGVVAVLALLIIVRSSLDSGVFRHRKETSKSLKACGKPWIVGGNIIIIIKYRLRWLSSLLS